MINIPLSFSGKAKQPPLLIVGKRKLGCFAHIIYLERMLKSILHHYYQYQCIQLFSLYSQYLCMTLRPSPQITVSEIQVFLQRRAWFIFSSFFRRMSKENATCTCWFLKSSLTRRVSGHTNTQVGCSCSNVFWGSLNLWENTGFHRCSTWLSLKDSKHFFVLFVMLGNSHSVQSLCKETFRCGSQVYE